MKFMEIKELQGNLELTNNGELAVFFIGVGSAFSKVHYQNNLLIVKGSDHLLIDCGITCPRALYKYGSNISKIKNVLITHSHADHIGGLEELALMGRYVTKERPKMYISKEYKKILWNDSLKGGSAYGESAAGRFLTFDDYFETVVPSKIQSKPRDLFEVNCGSINVKIYRTKHVSAPNGKWDNPLYSVGVLIDDSVLFPSDTQFDFELLDWATKNFPIKAIFHDCQFYPGGVHASYEALNNLEPTIKQKMFLCHYGDDFKNFNPEADGFAGYAKQKHFYLFK